MRIFTEEQVADLNRRHRLLQEDLKKVEAEKAELARLLVDERQRNDRNKHLAGLYVGIAMGAIADAYVVDE